MNIDISKIESIDLDFVKIIENIIKLEHKTLSNRDALDDLLKLDTNKICRKYITKYGVVQLFIKIKDVFNKYSHLMRFEEQDNREIILSLVPSHANFIQNRQVNKPNNENHKSIKELYDPEKINYNIKVKSKVKKSIFDRPLSTLYRNATYKIKVNYVMHPEIPEENDEIKIDNDLSW